MARKKETRHPRRPKISKSQRQKMHPPREDQKVKLEVVLKCDVAGTVEAVRSSILAIQEPGVEIDVIQAGIGKVTKSDVLMAETGSKLIVGFNVGVMPKLQNDAAEHGVEIRLYDVIYYITRDLEQIAHTLIAREPQERITGIAKIIATFKGSRKGIIIGCEVQEGLLELGKEFRVITAMGPAYSGKIQSLQIERTPVKVGKVGQQVGIGIADWKKASIGDTVECYESVTAKGTGPWKPRSGIFYFIAK